MHAFEDTSFLGYDTVLINKYSPLLERSLLLSTSGY
jgi:hypothetical protein